MSKALVPGLGIVFTQLFTKLFTELFTKLAGAACAPGTAGSRCDLDGDRARGRVCGTATGR